MTEYEVFLLALAGTGDSLLTSNVKAMHRSSASHKRRASSKSILAGSRTSLPAGQTYVGYQRASVRLDRETAPTD
eukprot:166026-Prorocentrum_minimum.AAC.2